MNVTDTEYPRVPQAHQ